MLSIKKIKHGAINSAEKVLWVETWDVDSGTRPLFLEKPRVLTKLRTLSLSIARDGLLHLITALTPGLMALGYGAVFGSRNPSVSAMHSWPIFFRDQKRDHRKIQRSSCASAAGGARRAIDDTPGPPLVSIFLSPLDVHINRAPIAGTVTNVSYTRGKFLMATDKNASLVNEQNALTIQGEKITVVCKQIAGILARRIICWKHAGERVKLGERFGLIKFSSRTDVLLPAEVEVLVTEGMRVRGGTTVIGRIK